MWLLALLLVGACAQDGADAEQPDPRDDDDDDADLYNHYDEEVNSSTASVTQTQESQNTRVRRHEQTTSPVRTLSPDEIFKVRGVLNKMLSGGDLNAFTQESATDLRRLIDIMSSPTPDLMSDLAQFTPRSTPPFNEEGDVIKIGRSDIVSTDVVVDGIIFKKYEKRQLDYPRAYRDTFAWIKRITFPKSEKVEEYCLAECVSNSRCMSITLHVEDRECSLIPATVDDVESAELDKNKRYNYYQRVGPQTTTTLEPTTLNTTTGLEMSTKPQIIDIRRLVEIIATLTMNTVNNNLTELFNATLQKYGIPMCGETTTTEEPTYDFANATIISKCFVCGLDAPGIPHDAYCADAFSGDFLPLVPVDPRARGQIAKYRKYCRYLDVPGTLINETQPRSVFGRWTGGCSVRWIDLSGVYTQRACRNRHHAAMGKHYVSKRMAKLEMALKNEDNGCIISPMSSLVPLSRGISLYARFHACVCTGNWCNGAPPARTPAWPRHTYLAVLAASTTVTLLV